MKRLLSNLKEDINLKDNLFMKIYLIILTILNTVYISLEIYKSKLLNQLSRNSYTLKTNGNLIETPETLIIMKSMNISKINYNIIEKLIVGIGLFFIILIFIKYRKSNKSIKNFLVTNLIYWVLVFVVGYVISLIFPIHFLHLTQQVIAPVGYTIVFLIYYTIKTWYNKRLVGDM